MGVFPRICRRSFVTTEFFSKPFVSQRLAGMSCDNGRIKEMKARFDNREHAFCTVKEGPSHWRRRSSPEAAAVAPAFGAFRTVFETDLVKSRRAIRPRDSAKFTR